MGVSHNLRAGPQPTRIEDPLRRVLEARSLLRTARHHGNLEFFRQRWLEYSNVPLQELRSPNLLTQLSNPGIARHLAGAGDHVTDATAGFEYLVHWIRDWYRLDLRRRLADWLGYCNPQAP